MREHEKEAIVVLDYFEMVMIFSSHAARNARPKGRLTRPPQRVWSITCFVSEVLRGS